MDHKGIRKDVRKKEMGPSHSKCAIIDILDSFATAKQVPPTSSE